MLATSLSKDLYKRFVNPGATDRQLLSVARLAAFAGGVGGVVLAMQVNTIVDALQIFYSLLGVSLFVPVLAGLLSRRGGAPEAFASIAAGIGVLLLVRSATDASGFGLLSENLAGLGAAAAAFALVAAVRGRRAVFSEPA
jgi:SSS family solute:Na+ symporter